MSKCKPWFQYGVLALLVMFVSIKTIGANYGSGVDEPLPWVFNHLFAFDLAAGKDMIFPHGPLAFLLYPVPFGHNLLISLFVYILVFGGVAVNFFRLNKLTEKNDGFLSAIFILLILFTYIEIQLAIIGWVTTSLLLYHLEKRKLDFAIAIFLTALAFYIKVYVGVISAMILASFFVLQFFQKGANRKILILWAIALPVLYLVLWLVMYRTFGGFVNHFIGALNLATDNSVAVALYPDNNWKVLGLMLLLYFALPLVIKNKRVLFYFLLMFVATFAAWKHGISRQDISHGNGLFMYLLLYFAILYSFLTVVKTRLIVISSAIVLLFYINYKNYILYEENKIHVVKVQYWIDIIQNFDNFSIYHKQISKEGVAHLKLDSAIRNEIGSASIDIYPWDYAYIPANDFNWIPRPIIHSYASYTSWLDNKNSEHLLSEKAPEYILWHNSPSHDSISHLVANGGNAYLLNEDPKAILTFFDNYSLIEKTKTFSLWKQSNQKRFGGKRKKLEKKKITWEEWVAVPDDSTGVVRLNVNIKKSFVGKLKGTFYKDQAIYLRMKFENDSIVESRIVPKNAVDGLWIAPLIDNIMGDEFPLELKQISFYCKNKSDANSNIVIEWEVIPYNLNYNKSHFF